MECVPVIRKLTAADHNRVIEFLSCEPAFNLFIIGDMENFGYHQDFQDLWGDFDEQGDIRAVLLRYYDSYIPYTRTGANWDGFIDIIRKRDDWACLSGKQEIIEQFRPLYEAEGLSIRSTYFCELASAEHLPPETELPAGYRLIRAGLEHVDQIVDISLACFDSFRPEQLRKSLTYSLEKGTDTIWCIEHEGRIVSKAQTTAENSRSAMIIGVCTLEEHRGKGLATACMRRLCKEQLSLGRSLCLFYDNPQAGRIYRRLGFKDIGRWAMVKRP